MNAEQVSDTLLGEGDGDFVAYRRLIDLGIALSAEHDHDRLMERILLEAKDFTNADAGTLYLKTDDDALCFQILRIDSLDIALGGTTGLDINFPDVKLLDEDGAPNLHNVASAAANSGESINIQDAYTSTRYDFSGTKAFDERSGYRSTSFLTVPLKNHDGIVIGVMQLLNAQNRDTGEVIPFSDPDFALSTEGLNTLTAIALSTQPAYDLRITGEVPDGISDLELDLELEIALSSVVGHCN